MSAQFRSLRKAFALLPLLVTLAVGTALAQGTAFTFQGRLGDAASPVNGAFDMQFKLFDGADPASSNPIGTPITLNNPLVQVTNGVFTVQLDFGAAALPGADRYLEIGLRRNGTDPYTVLSPRSKISSSPYAIRSLNATGADSLSPTFCCIQNTQISSLDASKLTGTLPSSTISAGSLPSGSGNYIQNTSSQQASANFNIDGTGKAGTFDAATRYNIGGNAAFSVTGNSPPSSNTFAGVGAGASNAPDVFSGNGNRNSFFGADAGKSNTSGDTNSFFGDEAGKSNTSGRQNSFFGFRAGFVSTAGGFNSFFGAGAGAQSTTGIENSFFGASAGASTTTGGSNTMIGGSAGFTNSTGRNLTMIGLNADVTAADLNFAAAIGSFAKVGTSDTIVLGKIAGSYPILGSRPADTVLIPGTLGIGNATSPTSASLHIAANSGQILLGNAGCSTGFTGIGFAPTLSGCTNYSLLGNGTETIINRPTGGSIGFGENNVRQMTIAAGGNVGIATNSPTSRLHVVGNGLFTGNLTVNGTLNATLSAANLPADSTAYIHNATAQQSGNFNITGTGTAGDFVALNKVGVGTTAPAALLHVSGGSTGIIPNPNSSMILERNASHFLSILGPSTEQTGILFGEAGRDGGANSIAGIVFNSSGNANGLQLRTGGNVARMTISGEGAITISPQTRRLSLSAAAFTATKGSNFSPFAVAEDLGELFLSGDLFDKVVGLANVSLPDGAVVTRLRARVNDSVSDSGKNVTVTLKRQSFFDTTEVAASLMAQASSSGALGIVIVSDSSISSATIDNANYNYYIKVDIPATTSCCLDFFGVVIDYTVTTPLP